MLIKDLNVLGRKVVLDEYGLPKVVNDGVTIARAIELPEWRTLVLLLSERSHDKRLNGDTISQVSKNVADVLLYYHHFSLIIIFLPTLLNDDDQQENLEMKRRKLIGSLMLIKQLGKS
ncbi:hypothetical protein Tco_1257336 [Tanacetum coccineum]